MGVILKLWGFDIVKWDKWSPKYDKWIRIRDQKQDVDQKAYAQQKADYYLHKYHIEEVFKDPYRKGGLLSLFGLNWHTDVYRVFTNRFGDMRPYKVKAFLRLLEEREPVFEKNILGGESFRYRRKYERLKSFLQKAIHLNELVFCYL